MYVGKINRIFNYDRWLVRVSDKEEARKIPIGDFVKVNDELVGVIVGNHQDVPDDYLAKDISGEVSDKIFIDELEEEKVYYKILGIGRKSSEKYGVKRPPSLKDEVHRMSSQEILEFHSKKNGFSFSYYSDIIDFEKIEPEIIIKILDKLDSVFEKNPDSKKIITALKKHTRRLKN